MEQSKKALKTILDIMAKVVKADEDGKISLAEGIGIGIASISLVNVFKNIPAIEAEFKAITPEGIAELIAEFSADFDIADQAMEAKIKAGAAVLGQLIVSVLTQLADASAKQAITA